MLCILSLHLNFSAILSKVMTLRHREVTNSPRDTQFGSRQPGIEAKAVWPQVGLPEKTEILSLILILDKQQILF